MKHIKKRFILNNPNKILLYNIIKKVSPFTMLKYDGLCQIYDCIKDADNKKIEGSLVEMGCWGGGCGAFMAWCAKQNKSNRGVWLFDSFEGLPKLSEEENEWMNHIKRKPKNQGIDAETIKNRVRYKIDEAIVKEVLEIVGVKDNTHIIKGWFQDTVPQVKENINKIAILHLDGDIYTSTKYCLEQLYDLVAPDGYIIIDDYHLGGCRKALYEFFYKRNINPYIENNPYWGKAVFRKK